MFKADYDINVGNKRTSQQDAIYCDQKNGVFAVADGMGGMNSGDLASAKAIDCVEEFSVQENKSIEELLRISQLGNSELFHFQHGNAGSTLSAMWINDGKSYIIHIGDSRIYHLSNGDFKQITKDHNLAGNPYVLLRYFGDPSGNFDTHVIDVSSGDKFLMCSDGLHGEVSDHIIYAIMETSSVEVIVSELMKEVLSTKARDNISMVAIEI